MTDEEVLNILISEGKEEVYCNRFEITAENCGDEFIFTIHINMDSQNNLRSDCLSGEVVCGVYLRSQEIGNFECRRIQLYPPKGISPRFVAVIRVKFPLIAKEYGILKKYFIKHHKEGV